MQTHTEDHVSTGAPQVTMQERREPTFVQFMREGDMVQGRLSQIENVEVGQERKPAVRYLVEAGVLRSGFFSSDKGEMQAFLGTYGIDSKLRPDDIGHYVQIRFTGLDQTVSRNGNQMKKFEIRVSSCVVENDPVGF